MQPHLMCLQSGQSLSRLPFIQYLHLEVDPNSLAATSPSDPGQVAQAIQREMTFVLRGLVI